MKRLLLLAVLCLPLAAQTAINDTLYLQGSTPWTGQITVSWPAFTSCTGTPIARGSRTSAVNAGVVAISLWASDCAAPSFAYAATYRTMGGANHGQTWTETWVVPSSPSIVTLAIVRQTSTLTAKPLAHASTHASGGSDPVTLAKAQVGLANVDNTADANKPVSAAQQAALDLKANAASPTFTGNVSIGSTVSLPSTFCGDGTVDKTAAINSAIGTVYAAGGGIVQFPAGRCLVSGQILLPNDAAAPKPHQAPVRLLGVGGSHNAVESGGDAPYGGTILDLRYSGTGAQIDTRGNGYMELAYFSLVNGGTSTTPMFQTTNTVVNIHDNMFYGAHAGQLADQDAIVLGGTSTTENGTATAAFQGYGTVIWNNHFSRIRRAVYLRVFANGVVIRDNVVWDTCGAADTTAAAIEMDGDATNKSMGMVLTGNIFESGYYPYTVKITKGVYNHIVNNSFYDATAATVAYVRFENLAGFSLVTNAVAPSNLGVPVVVSDADGRNLVLDALNGNAVKLTSTITATAPLIGTNTTAGGYGVIGNGPSGGAGVRGVAADGGYGIEGVGTTSYGAHGVSTSGAGVVGESSSGVGVSGTSTTGDGVKGAAGNGQNAVNGTNAGSGIGVYGSSASGKGVWGVSGADAGVWARGNGGEAALVADARHTSNVPAKFQVAGTTVGYVDRTGAHVGPISTPVNAAAACNAGAIWADAGYVYVCTASGAVKRAAIAAW